MLHCIVQIKSCPGCPILHNWMWQIDKFGSSIYCLHQIPHLVQLIPTVLDVFDIRRAKKTIRWNVVVDISTMPVIIYIYKNEIKILPIMKYFLHLPCIHYVFCIAVHSYAFKYSLAVILSLSHSSLNNPSSLPYICILIDHTDIHLIPLDITINTFFIPNQNCEYLLEKINSMLDK